MQKMEDNIELRQWLEDFKLSHPLVIAGPCSAETEEQVLETATRLAKTERHYNAGIKKLGVVHRGFSTYEKTKYRNIPEWQLAIELQDRFPYLPIICDPSHITGKRDMIQQVSQQALDLNYDGLMIETHNNPDKAWSDAAQQVTPEALKQILKNLVIRNKFVEAEAFNDKLSKLRLRIDEYDSKLIEILGKRMRIADEIGVIKKENNVAILQNRRWKEILERMKAGGSEESLGEDFILQLFRAIHQESISHQQKVINKEE